MSNPAALKSRKKIILGIFISDLYFSVYVITDLNVTFALILPETPLFLCAVTYFVGHVSFSGLTPDPIDRCALYANQRFLVTR